MTECGGSLYSNIDEFVKRCISFHPNIQMNPGQFQFIRDFQFPCGKEAFFALARKSRAWAEAHICTAPRSVEILDRVLLPPPKAVAK